MTTHYVTADIGASGSRILSNTIKEVRNLRNNMVFIPETKKVDLVPTKMTVDYALDVSITRDKESDYFPVRALIGDLADRYSSAQTTPNGMVNKTKQQVNYVSAITSVAISLMEEDTTSVPEVALYLALPPNEAKQQKEYAKEQFNGVYTVKFNKFDKEVKFNITSVETYEESFLAIMSFFYHTDSRKKPLANKYTDGLLLSIDIGASTTDLVTVENLVYKDRSGKTYKTGGNVVRDDLINLVLDTFGFELPQDKADIAVAEGRIRLGNVWRPIPELVEQAKRNYADGILASIIGYFTLNKLPIELMRAFCVSGGGSIESKYTDETGNVIKTSEPMSFYITEALRKYCDTIEVEHYDENPREANIKGLFMRARIDLFKKGKLTAEDLQRA